MTTSRVASPPASLTTIAARVNERIDALLDAESARWTALDPALTDMLAPLTALVTAGGKRLRAAFCYWGFVGAGGDPDAAAVIDAGAAFELLQAFALLHDDVMDGSATRRGRATAHVEAADAHTSQCWRGESRRFGEGVAILVGDLAHVYADVLLTDAGPEALAVWNELRIELNAGQYLDLVATAQGSVDRDRAHRIARYKSGKYTIERPLHLGAALAGRYAELGPALSGYGDPLGEAFQLRDDLLGAFGDQTVTGKPVGDDLREGKPTPLLAAATAAATPAQRAMLATVGDPALDAAGVEAVQDVLVASGAVAEIEAHISVLTAQAIDALDDGHLTAEAAAALADLAAYVAWRER